MFTCIESSGGVTVWMFSALSSVGATLFSSHNSYINKLFGVNIAVRYGTSMFINVVSMCTNTKGCPFETALHIYSLIFILMNISISLLIQGSNSPSKKCRLLRHILYLRVLPIPRAIVRDAYRRQKKLLECL